MITKVEEILLRLYELRDLEYQQFHSKLVPNLAAESILGVRIPILKKLAKELYGTSVMTAFMENLPHNYYEENQLHIMMICLERDFDRCIHLLEQFLPYADNWAVTDQSSPACFKKRHEELIPILNRWMESEHVYTVRYALNIYMREFLDDDFETRFLDRISALRSEEYYLNMMIAWYFATALAKQYDAVIPYLEQDRLDKWTHNKTIQKAIESYRITSEQKQYLRTLKRR